MTETIRMLSAYGTYHGDAICKNENKIIIVIIIIENSHGNKLEK